jgi:small subunit ribosomal protein S6
MAKKKSAESSSVPVEQKPNQYEAMFLLPASAAAEVDKSITTCRGIIERHGGAILVIKKWDERKLLYEVKKQKRGLYVIAYFTAPGNAITGIERDVNLSEEVLRVLVTDAEHMNQSEMEAVEPQPIQPREERSWDRPPMGEGGGYGGDRGDRGDRGGDRGSDRGGERRPRSEAPAGAGKE